jgi:hypothetical protein
MQRFLPGDPEKSAGHGRWAAKYAGLKTWFTKTNA